MPWRKLGTAVVPDAVELSCEERCRVKVDADNVLVLTPGAVISVGSTFYVPLSSRDSLVPAHEVELRAGRVDAISPGARAMPLVISGPGSSHVALRAAEAQVAVQDGHMAAQVTEGGARVGSSRKWISLDKGQMAIVPAQGGPSLPTTGIEAPEWTAVADGPAQSPTGACNPGIALRRGDSPAILGGCWKPVARAATYVVELSRDAGFSTIASTDSASTPFWSKALPEGRYFVRVRAIDVDGLVSANSSPRRLGTIQAKLPPGSVVDPSARTFTLPQGRSLELGDPSGLEIALDGGGFLPAQRFVVVDSAPRHVVRVRFKDDPSSVGSAVLQRRALSADVNFSPKLASWPRDAIDITVTLSDASGVIDPSQVSPRMHVLLGLTEIAVEWSRSGPVWAARVAPRNVAPTVIRVIAEDEFGTILGRNFMEVDQGRTAAPSRGYVAQK
jgi:hypothetical protein